MAKSCSELYAIELLATTGAQGITWYSSRSLKPSSVHWSSFWPVAFWLLCLSGFLHYLPFLWTPLSNGSKRHDQYGALNLHSGRCCNAYELEICLVVSSGWLSMNFVSVSHLVPPLFTWTLLLSLQKTRTITQRMRFGAVIGYSTRIHRIWPQFYDPRLPKGPYTNVITAPLYNWYRLSHGGRHYSLSESSRAAVFVGNVSAKVWMYQYSCLINPIMVVFCVLIPGSSLLWSY